MEIKVEKEFKDHYFDRTIVDFLIKKGDKEIVKLQDVKDKLKEKFPEGFIFVYTIKNIYGMNAAKGIAHIYKDEAVAKKVLQPFILKKNGAIDGKEKG